nr:14018_t:CDS:2 [Entrophospora candida]
MPEKNYANNNNYTNKNIHSDTKHDDLIISSSGRSKGNYNNDYNNTEFDDFRSMHQILMVSLYLLIILLISSAIMYDVEHGEFLDPATLKWYRYNGTGMEISPFQSIIDTLWWSITTLTTTGYGDAVPVTASGKFVAGVTMICGIMVIALLTSIIGSNFVSEWALHKQTQHQLRLRKKTAAAQNEYQVSKTKRIRILRSQNEIMLETISEIQDKLSDLNPPLYYKKYKNIRAKYIEATKRISELEAKLEKCSQTIRNFESPDDYQIHSIENNNNNDTAGDGFDSNVFDYNDLINSNDSSVTYHENLMEKGSDQNKHSNEEDDSKQIEIIVNDPIIKREK